MIVVSDTSPLCYLILLGHSEILAKLYGSIHVAKKVMEELDHAQAPLAIRDWAKNPPPWVRIHPNPEEFGQSLTALDPGERSALLLYEQLHADVVLLDEAAARVLAIQRGLKVSGTLGVLCHAAQTGLLQLPAALDMLRKTNFRASPELWKALYMR
jgi:predicted nucleic acid-binding protein